MASQGREFLNEVAVPTLASKMTKDDIVYVIGRNPNYDYASLFPLALTTDIDKHVNPDLLDDICNSKIVTCSAKAIVFIGVFEFLNDPTLAFREMYRILKTDGYLLAALPGKGYWPCPGETGGRVSIELIPDLFKNYKIRQITCFYADNNEMESCIVLAQKV